jgi:hypothetical protein
MAQGAGCIFFDFSKDTKIHPSVCFERAQSYQLIEVNNPSADRSPSKDNRFVQASNNKKSCPGKAGAANEQKPLQEMRNLLSTPFTVPAVVR